MGSRPRPPKGRRGERTPALGPRLIQEARDRAGAAELPHLLPHHRWFGSKGRAIAAVRAADWARVGERGWLGLVGVAFGQEAAERYLVAFVLREGGAPRGAVSLALDLTGASVCAEDAFDDPAFCRALLEAFGRGRRVSSVRGHLRFVVGDGGPALAQAARLKPRRLGVEQSNTSVVYGDRFVLKALRRIEPGRSLDYEIGAFLTSRVGFAHVPQVAGAIEYVPAAGPAATLAILQRYVPNHGDGWAWALEQLGGLRDRVVARGRRERIEASRLDAIVHASAASMLGALADAGCAKIRIHGDYHLGQTLRTDDGFVLLDFEGEPARPAAERRAKQSPLTDVAGMLRSFDYAAATAFGSADEFAATGEAWRRLAAGVFLDAYVEAVSQAPVRLLPASRPALERALAAFELDKALYEVRYEIDHRPGWVGVPLRGLCRLWGGV